MTLTLNGTRLTKWIFSSGVRLSAALTGAVEVIEQ